MFWHWKKKECILNESEERILCDYCSCMGEKKGEECKRCKGKGYIDLEKKDNGRCE